MRSYVLVSLALAALAACSSSSSNDSPSGSACVAVPSADCKPLVDPPTFDAIYTQILQPSCASGGVSCHGAASGTSLSFGDVDQAYAMFTRRELVGEGDAARVLPHDAACSPLMKRIMADDPAVRMPRGSQLSEPETCAVTKWIANGAPR